ARLLVEEYVRHPAETNLAWGNWLPLLQQRWHAEVTGRPLPWYAEAKLAQGAFATFLGLRIEQCTEGNRWHAVAVGDSCLFHLRQDCLCQAFPVACSEHFGSWPWLIGSRDLAADVEQTKEVHAVGDWQEEDRFWLMTDALAQWFLRGI